MDSGLGRVLVGCNFDCNPFVDAGDDVAVVVAVVVVDCGVAAG